MFRQAATPYDSSLTACGALSPLPCAMTAIGELACECARAAVSRPLCPLERPGVRAGSFVLRLQPTPHLTAAVPAAEATYQSQTYYTRYDTRIADVYQVRSSQGLGAGRVAFGPGGCAAWFSCRRSSHIPAGLWI